MSDKPGVYLKFEVGISWNARHPGKNREITFMSKNMRNRNENLSRQLPVVGSSAQEPRGHNNHESFHYYSGRPHFAQQYAQPAGQPLPANPHNQNRIERKPLPHQLPRQFSSPSAYLHPRTPPGLGSDPSPDRDDPEFDARSSRSRSSHERGKSAPPPFNDSPWDAEPEPMGATALPRQSDAPGIWKALPAAPSDFRLDEPDLAWTPITLPMGFMYSDIGEGSWDNRSSRRESFFPSAARTTDNIDDRDKVRPTDIESLATALMTVDNGFEDQWWYQGPRLVNIAGDLISSTVLREYASQGGTVGWAVADNDHSAGVSRGDTTRTRRAPSSGIDIVSPLSETASATPSSFVGMRRTLTTRSEELHM
jgi:hypothetical protein